MVQPQPFTTGDYLFQNYCFDNYKLQNRKKGEKIFHSFEFSKHIIFKFSGPLFRMIPYTSSYWTKFTGNLKRVKMT